MSMPRSTEPMPRGGAVVLAALALTLAGGALVADTIFVRDPGATAHDARIDAISLARWIRDERDGLRVVDVRSREAYDEFHVPGATRASADSMSAFAVADSSTVVVYDDGETGDDAAERARAALAARPVVALILDGGATAWFDEIMQPKLSSDASNEEKREFRDVAELSRWFGGMPRIVPAAELARTKAEAGAAARAARRGGC
jgi:rhodanese-related sulfurtransferase